MAHFAKLDSNNIVTQVIVVSNEVAIDEQSGIDFLRNLYKEPDAKWVQTSYNAKIRKNYAGVGYTYDVDKDAFIPPCPLKGFVLNEEDCLWYSPIEKPITYTQNQTLDGNPVPDTYNWNETTLNWELPTLYSIE
jgi:hypothetical protein